jgi:hypothetical protein
MFRNGLAIRIIATIFLVGLMIAGGFMIYKAGIAQGVSQAPVVATAISQAAQNGQPAPFPPMMYGQGYGYGYGYPMYGHPFGFFPLGAICGSIFFLFLIFSLMKMIFFGGMRHRSWESHKYGPWGRHWENGVPPMFDEWHKHAHGESTPSDSAATKTGS